MENYILYVILIAALFAAILAYFKLANRFNIIDKPNERSSHKAITLRGGGIIFYIGSLLWYLCFGYQYPYFFVGLTLIAGVSFVDDVKTLSFRVRLLFHFSAMLLMFYQWGLFVMPWYFLIIALIICTGIINAYNFMDGINGITGGYSLVIMGVLWYINNYMVTFVDNDFIYMILLSLLVFNIFNFRKKAKCFAGDVGSVSIAFIILFLLGKLILITGDFSYIILLVVYGVDSILTIIHRLVLHENISQPHRKHLYQLMANELNVPHVIVSCLYMSVQLLICIGFIYFRMEGYLYMLSVVLLLSIGYFCFMKKYFRLHCK